MTNAIEVHNLTFAYPDGRRALDGVNLTVARGERLALLGPNGSGKSTLLMHLNGLLAGDGDVCIGSLPVVRENLRPVRRRVGFVFQSPDDQLFSPTVFDDVAFGPRNAGWDEQRVRATVQTTLARVGLSGHEGRSPFHMSLGEKKLVSIATVVVLDPDVYVFDEPTGNLDGRGRKRVVEIMSAIGKTLVVATHDLELALGLATRAAVLDAGRIIAEGPVDDVLFDAQLLARLDMKPPVRETV